jgi:hypothetical protein
VGEQRKKRARVIWRFGEPVGTKLLPQEHSSCLDHHRRSLPISTLSHGSLLHTKLFHHLRIPHLTFPSLLRCVVNRCMHGLPVINNNIAFCEIHPLQLLLICFFCTTRIEQKSLSTASHCDITGWLPLVPASGPAPPCLQRIVRLLIYRLSDQFPAPTKTYKVPRISGPLLHQYHHSR